MKKIIKIENREFELYCNVTFKYFLEVNVYEVVRPKWKIFRTEFKTSKIIEIEKWENLEEGCIAILKDYLQVEKVQKEIEKKVKNFKKTIDIKVN